MYFSTEPGPNRLMDLNQFILQWITLLDLKPLLDLKNAVISAKYDEINNFVFSENWEAEAINGKIHWTRHNRYVCDRQTFNGPTRFMNHSCKSNFRILTVFYNHADQNLYGIIKLTRLQNLIQQDYQMLSTMQNLIQQDYRQGRRRRGRGRDER